MATKNSRKKESWWQTFPGVLTAVAGLITALAGLVAVLKNSNPSVQPPAVEQTSGGQGSAAAAGQESSRRAAPPEPTKPAEAKVAGAVSPMSAGSGVRTISLPAAEANFPAVKTVMTIVSARLEPLNAEKRSLRLKVRVANNGSAGARIYYWTFRLLMDDLPRAPSISPGYEEAEAQSVKDVEYVFEVPAATRKVVFRISRDEEIRDIPIDLTAAVP